MTSEAFTRPRRVRALDLFAGTGWGVACQRLGIDEHGVENMPEAVAVRERNGMHTIYRDVWEGLHADAQKRAQLYTERAPEVGLLLDMGVPLDEVYDLLIASPPCQTFSMAGAGAGRKALDEVLAAIDARLYLNPDALREFGERHDPKTALVLTPLAHVARDTPTYVVFEQVPPVLPVWERCAEEMRGWGYSVWTGYLQAEMYGVPQTRKRAILIARADGKEAKAPTPTHSRYHTREPKRLDEGVKPWVSMAEALGWGMTERPMVTAGNAIGRAEGVGGTGGKVAVNREKARGAWLRSNQSVGGEGRAHRSVEDPSLTMTQTMRSAQWAEDDGRPGFLVGNQVPKGNARDEYHARATDAPAQTMTSGMQYGQWSEDGRRVMRSNYSAGGDGTAEERGRTLRPDTEPSLTMTSKGAQWQNGTGKHAAIRDADEPAPTIHFGQKLNGVRWIEPAAPWPLAEINGEPVEVCPSCADPVDYHDGGGFCATCQNCQDPELGRPGFWNTSDGEPPLVRPAPTVTGGGTATGGAEPFGRRGRDIIAKMRERVNDQTGTEFDAEWPGKRPGLTIAGRGLVPNPGHNSSRFDDATKSRNDGVRVTVEEAAALQSYPADFDWDAEFVDPKTGRTKAVTKTNKFLQVGNAVPPLLAEAILRELLS